MQGGRATDVLGLHHILYANRAVVLQKIVNYSCMTKNCCKMERSLAVSETKQNIVGFD